MECTPRLLLCTCSGAYTFAYKKHLFNVILLIWSRELKAGRNTLSEQQPQDYVGLNPPVEFIPPVHGLQGDLTASPSSLVSIFSDG